MSLVPTAAIAQSAGYKLVIAYSEGGVTTVDYPSKARCDAARTVVMAERQRRLDASKASLMPGQVLVGSPRIPEAFCIPG